jgi:hypothetical protein
MKLKSLSLSLAVALSALGVALDAKANPVPTLKPDAVSEISWDGSKVSDGLSAQPKDNPVLTLTARDRGTHINLRSQPTANSRSVGYGVPGDLAYMLQCVQDRDTPGSDLNWCKVQFPQSGAVGWIRSDFLIFREDGE